MPKHLRRKQIPTASFCDLLLTIRKKYHFLHIFAFKQLFNHEKVCFIHNGIPFRVFIQKNRLFMQKSNVGNQNITLLYIDIQL